MFTITLIAFHFDFTSAEFSNHIEFLKWLNSASYHSSLTSLGKPVIISFFLVLLILTYGITTGLTSSYSSFYVDASVEDEVDVPDTSKSDTDKDGITDDQDTDDDNDEIPDGQDTDDDNDNVPDDQDTDDDNDGIPDEDEIIPAPAPTVDNDTIPIPTPAIDNGTVPIDDNGTVPIDDNGTVPIDDNGTLPIDDNGTVPIDDNGTALSSASLYLKVELKCQDPSFVKCPDLETIRYTVSAAIQPDNLVTYSPSEFVASANGNFVYFSWLLSQSPPRSVTYFITQIPPPNPDGLTLLSHVTGDCKLNSNKISGVINPGAALNCTIVNEYPLASHVVVKNEVICPAGYPIACPLPSSFDFEIDVAGPDVISADPRTFNVNNFERGTSITIAHNAGSPVFYEVLETNTPPKHERFDLVQSQSEDCIGYILAWKHVPTCTFTNEYKPAPGVITMKDCESPGPLTWWCDAIAPPEYAGQRVTCGVNLVPVCQGPFSAKGCDLRTLKAGPGPFYIGCFG